MRFRLISVLLLAPALWLGQKKPNPLASQPPRTVDEAVKILKTQWLSSEDREWVLRNPEEHLVYTLYRPFGTGVRNSFGLWGRNPELLASCQTKDPEDCSVIIFKRLWETIREDADPALVRNLDCQFELSGAIVIETKPISATTMGYFLKRLQAQIDQQLSLLQPVSPGCQGPLRLKALGKPDLSCWASVQRDERVALDRLLYGMSFNNSFRVQHAPPELQLVFYRPCHWQNPPPPPPKIKLKEKDESKHNP